MTFFPSEYQQETEMHGSKRKIQNTEGPEKTIAKAK